MADKPKNIGDLFKENFEDFEVKRDSSGWAQMERKLMVMKFLRFDLTTFNVYYASLTVIIIFFYCFFVSGQSTSPEEFFENKNKEKSNDLPVPVSEDSTDSSSYFSNESKKEKQKKVAPAGEKTEQSGENSIKGNINSNEVPNSPETLLVDTISADTVIKEVIVPVEKKEPKKAPQKKIIYVTRQDTVIVVDTVKTNKNRKKR